MTWTYRLIDISDENDGEYLLGLYEVFFDKKGVPMAYTEMNMVGESVHELRQVIEWCALALDKPVVQKTDFVGSISAKEIDND
jgi:hypothetical protein